MVFGQYFKLFVYFSEYKLDTPDEEDEFEASLPKVPEEEVKTGITYVPRETTLDIYLPKYNIVTPLV